MEHAGRKALEKLCQKTLQFVYDHKQYFDTNHIMESDFLDLTGQDPIIKGVPIDDLIMQERAKKIIEIFKNVNILHLRNIYSKGELVGTRWSIYYVLNRKNTLNL